MKKMLTYCVYINGGVMILLSLYLFLIPAGLLIYDLNDPGLGSDKTPRCALRWHRSLSPKYERWARQCLAQGPAPGLEPSGVSGTEWPLFGSVFYLWATESLQQAVEADPSLSDGHPKDYARGAIRSAAALVVDPNQATWVKDYWGDDYLEKENLFYRMMLISAMTSYEKLIGDGKFMIPLRQQVESLAQELDDSPYGLLDDYPGYCYPVDISAAIAAVQRADTVLGTDHSEFVTRAVRGFQDTRLDPDTHLPGYLVEDTTGQALDAARGIGLSFMLIWAPELWPETAHDWYQRYEKHFWQQDHCFAGFREYAKHIDVGWLQCNDPDAGPVVKGYGTAACAFGIAAARAAGRYDHARALAAEALVGAWPLPDGTLLMPRLLSDHAMAPYLGEATLLFIFAHRSPAQVEATTPGPLPAGVYIGLLFYIALGCYELYAAFYTLRRWKKNKDKSLIPLPKVQCTLWAILMLLVFITWYRANAIYALVPLLCTLLLPQYRIKQNQCINPPPGSNCRGQSSSD